MQFKGNANHDFSPFIFDAMKWASRERGKTFLHAR